MYIVLFLSTRISIILAFEIHLFSGKLHPDLKSEAIHQLNVRPLNVSPSSVWEETNDETSLSRRLGGMKLSDD